jgi:hypothetical protein
MNHKHVSTSSAKDDNETLDLNELALAMYADSLGLTDKEYEELRALSRKASKAKLEAIWTAIAFIAISVAAIVIAITNWGWK